MSIYIDVTCACSLFINFILIPFFSPIFRKIGQTRKGNRKARRQASNVDTPGVIPETQDVQNHPDNEAVASRHIAELDTVYAAPLPSQSPVPVTCMDPGPDPELEPAIPDPPPLPLLRTPGINVSTVPFSVSPIRKKSRCGTDNVQGSPVRQTRPQVAFSPLRKIRRDRNTRSTLEFNLQKQAEQTKNLSRALADKVEDLAELRTTSDQMVTQLRNEITACKTELTAKDNIISNLKREHRKDTRDMKSKHNSEMNAQKKEISDKIQQKCDSVIRDMNEGFEKKSARTKVRNNASQLPHLTIICFEDII